MPSKSPAQHKLMAAVAHNPAFAKKVGISQKVGKEFAKDDEGKKFKGGGLYDNINATQRHCVDVLVSLQAKNLLVDGPVVDAFIAEVG